ncbi:MAG: hypothetical protein KJ749_07040 [Planctomycetes bacterium]|nr:hypothetical protein [Planctomycetota bacterium]
MPGRSQHASGATPSAGATGCARCAFCDDPVSANEAKLFGAELLCKDCMQVALSAQRAHKPLSKIAERAAEIDTAAMATNRIAFTAVISIISLGGIAIGAVLVNHVMKDTWERDNAARVLELSEEARNLDESQNPLAAVAKYDELLVLVGKTEARDEHLREVVRVAQERRKKLGVMIAAEEARRQKDEQARAESERLDRERREREQRERREQEQKLRNSLAEAHSSYAAKTAPFVEELEKLHAALTIKILYADYLRRVQDAKYVYDKWTENLTDLEKMAGLKSAVLLEEAMNCYIEATDSWSKLLSSRYGGATHEAKMQERWADAAKKIAKAKQLIAAGE